MDISFDGVKEVIIENYKPNYKTIIVVTDKGEFEIDLHASINAREINFKKIPDGKFYSEYDKKEISKIKNL
jgi:hypothetical protein